MKIDCIGLFVNNMEYKRLVYLGVKSVSPPATMPWGQGTCYVSDPEGNLLEIGSFGE